MTNVLPFVANISEKASEDLVIRGETVERVEEFEHLGSIKRSCSFRFLAIQLNQGAFERSYECSKFNKRNNQILLVDSQRRAQKDI